MAKPFVDYFSRQIHTKIIATFNNRPIALTDTIIPVQVDLQNRKETQDKISKVLQEQQLHDLKKVYIMHMI
ncbi:MAG: hypothetical protein WCL18_01105 [bacterium]